MVKDLWQVARSRLGLALLICFLPLGTGAASRTVVAVADDWHASANTVALVTGVLSGLVSAAGCIVGGYVCDRMDRKTAYALYALLQAACVVGMALAPRTELMYIVFTTLYSVTMGFTYAAFSGSRARSDRARRGRDQVHAVRVALRYAHHVHDRDRRRCARARGAPAACCTQRR